MAWNSALLFDQPEFSDITISYNGRKTFCHKMILCTSSDYFKRLCGPGSQFAESQQDTIKLHEDDPDAIYMLLSIVYGIEVIGAKDNDWRLQLELSRVAQKYLYPGIYETATAKLYSLLAAVSDLNEIFGALVHIRNESDDDTVLQMADEMEQHHILGLLEMPEFRVWISNDTARMWKYLDELSEFKRALEPRKFVYCTQCRYAIPHQATGKFSIMCGHPVTAWVNCYVPPGSRLIRTVPDKTS